MGIVKTKPVATVKKPALKKSAKRPAKRLLQKSKQITAEGWKRVSLRKK